MTTSPLRLSSSFPRGLAQPAQGYRYSVDALLLAAFAARFPAEFWCDLGTGCGVVAHELVRRKPGSQGLAIERQVELVACARKNLSSFPVTVVQGDLRDFRWKRDVFDLVVCNPPYFEPGRGRINRNAAIAEARHAFHGTLIDFAAALGPALKSAGVFCYILPNSHHERILSQFLAGGWFPAGRLPIRPYEERAPNLIAVAISRTKRTPLNLDCLTLYREHRVFHDSGANFFAACLSAVSE